MIDYDQRTCGGLGLIFQATGSVYKQAVYLALLAALLSVVVRILYVLYVRDDPATHMLVAAHVSEIFKRDNPYVYTVFTVALGFVVVFRCENAYLRFWEARSSIELMKTKWADAALQIVIFDNISHNKSKETVVHFGHASYR